MTTHAQGWAAEPVDLTITEPADLIAALPALLGFTPEASLVLITLTDSTPRTVALTARQDLVLPSYRDPSYRYIDEREIDLCEDCDDYLCEYHQQDADEHDDVHPVMVEAIGRIMAVCEREGLTTAIAVLIDDDPTVMADLRELVVEGDDYGVDALHRNDSTVAHAALVEYLEASFALIGGSLVSAHLIGRIEADQPWAGFLGDRRVGLLPDPRASRLALASVLSGAPIRARRSDLASEIAPADPAVRGAVSAAIEAVRAEVEALDEAACIGFMVSIARNPGVEVGMERFSAADLARAAVAVQRTIVRDVMFAFAVGEYARLVESLMLELTRTSPSWMRAAPATLLAFSAYVRGQGAFASVAVETALAATPGYSLALLLDDALQCGLRPEDAEGIALASCESARLLGVAVPPPIPRRLR